MALQPHLKYTRIGSGPHTVEFWLDLLCPFSCRCIGNLESSLIPSVLDGQLKDKVTLLIRPYPQPWHPQGGYLAETALAFGRAVCSSGTPEDSLLWFKYYSELAGRLNEFQDAAIAQTNPTALREKLVALASDVLEQEGKAELIEKLNETLADKNEVVKDFKYFVKLGRQNGIHTTLTAVVNGIVDATPQSSWAETEWIPFLMKLGVL